MRATPQVTLSSYWTHPSTHAVCSCLHYCGASARPSIVGMQMLTSRGWGPDNFFVYDRSALPVESELGAYCAATHPHSMMVNEQLAFIVDQQGRKSYADNLIKVFEFSKGTRPVQVLPVTPDNRAQLLLEHFGIEPASAHES